MSTLSNQSESTNKQFNESTIKGNWMKMKGEIQKAWGKLTDDELEKTKGDIKEIAGLIQHRYGVAKESFSNKLNDIFKTFSPEGDGGGHAVKAAVKA
jgi:uncharacterized protein YjbJ (UPF0337 family)